MRRQVSDVARSSTVAVLVALLAGCAGARPAAPPSPAPPVVGVVPPPAVPAPTAPPPTPTVTPPVSVGPRAEAPAAPPAPPAPAVPTPPPTAPPVPAGQRGRFVVLNFDNADIETVIHAASEIIGFNYVLAPDVRGKVTVQTSGRIPQEDVFGVLLAILEVHGFTAVKAGDLYKIVRIEGARERAVPTIVGTEPDPARTTDEIITQIVPVRFASVNDLGTLLRPLISARGTLIANRETNVLIVTDAASNMRRLLDIIRLVDVPVALEELQIIQVQYADAAEFANVLNQVFASGRLRLGATPAVPAPAPVAPGVPAAPTGPAGTTGGPERPPLIVADRRSNSLIIQARKNEMEVIRRLLSQIDVNITGGRRVFIYYAENAKAKDLAATLNAIYAARETVAATAGAPPLTPPTPGQPAAPPTPPPVLAPGAPVGGAPGTAEVGLAAGAIRFIADEVTNAIIVTTTPRNWVDLEATIKQLDKMPRQVLIEVLVAEVTLTDDTRLGLDWAIKTGRFTLAQTSSGTTAIPTSPPAAGGTLTSPSAVLPLAGSTAGIGTIAQGLTAFTFGTDQIFAILNLLAAQDKINVISNPHVMTSENKKAVINVSTSVPVITGQQTSTISTPGTVAGTTTTTINTGGVNQTVEYRDAGVILTVTPRIGERGTVALDVKQEVNDVGAQVPPTNSPSFIKREAETSVVLINNQTLVLGGLITDRRENIHRGIPVLKDIPILGYLFGFKEQIMDKRELLLLITPRVVGTPVDAARVTEQMRRGTPDLEQAIRRAPRAPSIAPPAGAPAPTPAPGPGAEVVPAPPAPAAPVPPLPPVPAAPAPAAPEGVPAVPPAPPPPAPAR